MCLSPWPQSGQGRDLGSVDGWGVFDRHCPRCSLTHLHLLRELLTLPYSRTRNNHIKLIIFLSPLPPPNTWMRDRIPVWTCLNICQWRTLIPETGESPTSFSLLPEDSPPFSPHLSPQRCQRDHSLSSGVAGTGWDTQQGDTPSQLSRSAMAQVQTRQRYDLIYPPCLFSPRHLFCLQHLSDKTSKAAEIKQKITEQMRAEKIQGWDGEAARKARAEQPAENWK